METLNGILLPLWGTMIGSSFVFFLKKNINKKIQSYILSLSSGIMLSSSIWSLLIPSIEQSYTLFIPILGFVIGIFLLLIINQFVSDKPIYKNKIMIVSIILHNIPEGMAVGVAFAGIINGYMTLSMALLLSLGIAIQNIPEGAIISMPLYSYNKNKMKSFLVGCLSGIVEPIGALIAYLLTSKIIILLPLILSFASGAMVYVVIVDLLPSCNNKNTIIPFTIGFLLMIILEYLF